MKLWIYYLITRDNTATSYITLYYNREGMVLEWENINEENVI